MSWLPVTAVREPVSFFDELLCFFDFIIQFLCGQGIQGYTLPVCILNPRSVILNALNEGFSVFGNQLFLSILKELMNREDVTEVVNACDAGREGELILRSVYYLADCQKPMKRLWISSMEDEAIRDGFQNLRPGSDFDGLYKSALCRAKADWLVGINATRYFSLLYGTKLNVGRVMSPTLSLLVQRESEISAFVPKDFFTVKYSQKSVPQKWFSGLEVGQVLTPSKVSVKEGKTQPPHHYTEDLLLSSMETAGAKDMPEDAERKGLGTPATRAGILEKLVSTGMLERRKVKKQTILVPTELGNALITVLPEQLQSPLLTAEWENRLSQVQKGELESEDFLDGIRGMLTDLVRDYRPVSGADILFPSAENTVGKCPRCGRPVIERSKGYFCTGQNCKFVLWRDSRFFTLKQKTLDKRTAQLLLEKGRAPLKGCVSSKTGKVYDAAVVLEDDGERAHFKLVFGNG